MTVAAILKLMRTPVRIKSGFPSAMQVAKDLGVPKKVAKDLVALAEHSLETGVYVLPGVGRLVSTPRTARAGKLVKFPIRKKDKGATKSAAKR